MRSVSNFLIFLCFIFYVVSSSTSQVQSDEKNNNYKSFITEIIKIKEKFDYLSDQIDQLKSDLNINRDQLMNKLSMELKLSKQREDDLLNEINVMKKNLEDLRVKVEQEVSDSEDHEKECARREEAIKNQVNEEQSEMKRRVGALEKSVALAAPQVHLRSSDENYETKGPDFTWTISDLKNKAKQTNFELLSEVFSLKGYSFGAQAKLKLDGDGYLEISLAYKDLNESGTALDLKIIPEAHYTYKEEPSKNKMRQVNYLFTALLQYDVFYYDTWIISANNITDNNAYIDIHVEPPKMVPQGYTYNRVLTWAIDHFRSKREMTEQKLVWRQRSPYFYTGPKGYRVQALTWLNGYGEYKGKGLTVEIDFLTDPFDPDLSTSYKHQTTVTLFHPTDPTKVIVKSVVRDIKDGKYYMIDMGTHAEINNLLDGDTLYYQVKIIPA